MMAFLKKYRFEILILSTIIILFFVSRFYNILSIPIFTDEAIYIRWAQIAKNDASWRFISLTDGKQPMFVWITMIFMRLVQDPLLAGRLVSVMSGFFTVIGLFFLGREVFKNRWIGILCSFLYFIYPMAVVYDRMALYDSLVGTFSVWSLYLEVLLVKRLRLDIALILGMIIGGGVLTKTSGFFSIYLLPLTLLLFDLVSNDRLKRIITWITLAILATILAYMFYSILRLSPFFHIINEKNALFVYPLKDWLDHPFNFFIGNWKAVWDWLTTYMTYPVLLLIVSSFFISKNYLREKLLLFVWFLIPAISLALFGRTLYPRFIFFMTLFLLPLTAISLFKLNRLIKKKWIYYVSLLLLVMIPIQSDYLILTDFYKAPIPYSDVSQYNSDWTSGGGIKEAVMFFREEAKKGKIYIATQGTFGLMPFALEIYLIDNPNIEIEGFWPIGDTVPKKVLEESKKVPAYFVFYQPCQTCQPVGTAPANWNLTNIVLQYKKVYDYRYFTVYRLQ